MNMQVPFLRCTRIVLLLPSVIGLIQDASLFASDPAAVKLAANGTTMVIARVDTEALDLPPLLLSTIEKNPVLSGLASKVQRPLNEVKQAMDGKVCYLAADLPSTFPWLQSRLVTPAGVDDSQVERASKALWQDARLNVARGQGVFKAYEIEFYEGEARSRFTQMQMPGGAADGWLAAFEATKGFPVQICVSAPEYFRETIAEIDPKLPASFGGGPAAPLISSTEWVSLGLRPSDMTLRIVVSTTSSEAAGEVKERVPEIIGALLRGIEVDPATTSMALAIVGLLQPKVADTQVIYAAEDPAMTGALLQLGVTTLAATAEPMTNAETKNKMRQLMLGMHNYESAFGALPTYKDIRKEKKPSGLSWRVHILPFMEGGVELYNQFKLDEPWDSEHNKKLLEKMPGVYSPNIPVGSDEQFAPYHTTFVAPVGDRTIFGQNEFISFRNILDGTSNTVAIVEVSAENVVPWTAPQEYQFDKDSPAAGLRNIGGKVMAGFMDGSVRKLDVDLANDIWNAIFTRDGGEVINLN